METTEGHHGGGRTGQGAPVGGLQEAPAVRHIPRGPWQLLAPKCLGCAGRTRGPAQGRRDNPRILPAGCVSSEALQGRQLDDGARR